MIKQNYKKYIILLFFSGLLIWTSASTADTDKIQGKTEAATSSVTQSPSNPDKAIPVTEDTFICLKKMHVIRGFFVANLLGNLSDTVAAAEQAKGAVYPPGSVIQLIPTEVMIKHHKGWNPKTNDWEFFELEVSDKGSKIKVRGTTEVINKFGGNCFSCHNKAKPQWDLICEDNHGCDSLPIPNFVIRMIQKGDPRCK